MTTTTDIYYSKSNFNGGNAVLTYHSLTDSINKRNGSVDKGGQRGNGGDEDFEMEG